VPYLSASAVVIHYEEALYKVYVCTFDPLKCHILSFKTVVGYLCKFHIVNDERLASKMEGKTNFEAPETV